MLFNKIVVASIFILGVTFFVKYVKKEDSINDISINDISINNISINNININDSSINDISINDISINDISKLDKTTSVTDLLTQENKSRSCQTTVSLDKNENYFIKETIINDNNKWYDIIYETHS